MTETAIKNLQKKNLIPQDGDKIHISEQEVEPEVEVEYADIEIDEIPEEYRIITDGINLPSQLVQSRKLFSYFSSYKEITHTTASLVGTLATVSMVGAGRVRTFTDSPVSTYIAYIAPTASSKDPVIKGIRAVDRAVNPDATIVKSGSGLQSSGALNTMLGNCTGELILTIDEFGDVLGEILKGSGSSKGTLKAPLKEMYSVDHGEVYEGAIYSNQGGKIKTDDPVAVESLSFGILGVTTKTQLMEHVERKYLNDGTLNRFIFVDGTHHKPTESGTWGERDISPQLLHHLNTFQIIDEDSKKMRLEADALIYWKHGIGDHSLGTGELGNWCGDDDTRLALASRVKLNALRLATALAFFEGMEEVPKWVLEWCFNFTLLNMENFKRLYHEDTETSEIMEQIDAVLNWWDRRPRGEHISKTILAKTATRLKRMKSRQRGELLDELLERGEIVENKDGTFTRQEAN